MFKLLKYLQGRAAVYAVAAPLLMMLEVSMDLLQPVYMADIIDTGIASHNLAYVFHAGGKMLLVALIGLLGGAGCSICCSLAALRMGEKLRLGLFAKIQTLSFAEIDRFNTSSLITRLTNDVGQVQGMLLMILRGAVRAPLLCIGGMIMAVTLSPSLSLVFLAALPLIIVAVFLVLRKSFPLFGIVQRKIDRINAVMRESILGIRVIKAFTLENRQFEKFREANHELRDQGINSQNVNMLLWPLVMLVMNLSVIAVLWFGGNLAAHGNLEIGKVMAFVNYLLQIMGSLIMVVMIFLGLSRAKVSADRICEVLGTPPSVCDGSSSMTLTGRDIEFRNVSFKYNPHSENVLSNISLKIAAGEKIGIIGATGSGKSTFCNLIPRLYDPCEGQILIGGTDIKNYRLQELRKNIGVIQQDSVLFSGSIEDNLKFGNPAAAHPDLEKVARDAQAADFIQDKSGHFHHKVEQRGKNFSGGQKQRLSIARTLLMEPAILIMDDCSSALDLETEARLHTAINRRIAHSTVLVIAQRVTTVMDADRILVFENGQLAATGKHAELLQSNETYRAIAVSQLGGEVLDNVCS